MSFKEFVKTLTDNELEVIFQEIHSYENTGILKEDGLCREKIKEFNSNFDSLMPFFQFFLFEICRRKYQLN